MRPWLTHLPYIKKQAWPHGGFDFWPAGKMTVHPRVIINHTTETLGFPGYNGGAAAPHFTGSLETGEVRQHVPLNYGSRCLAVSTKEDYRNVWHTDRTLNITGTIQIEWIGAVTPGYPKRYGHYDIPNRFGRDDDALEFVARLWADIAKETGIPLDFSDYGVWVEYPDSYGVTASQRLNSRDFRDAMGLLAHQHAPANNHGDGLLGQAVNGKPVDMQKALVIAKGGKTTPIVKPTPDPRKGFTAAELRYAEGMLDNLGFEGKDVWAKTLNFQTWAGMEMKDGLPGPQTEKLLEAYMHKIDQVLANQKKILARLDEVPEDVWGHPLYGFSAHYHLRGGSLGKRTDHPNFPADPNSPADIQRRVAEKILGEEIPPYVG